MLNQVNSAEITAMSFHQGTVQRAYQILTSWFRDIETTLGVKGAIQECPILADGEGKEGGMLGHSILNQWISCSELDNLVSQLHIQSMNQNIRYRGQHGDSSVVK